LVSGGDEEVKWCVLGAWVWLVEGKVEGLGWRMHSRQPRPAVYVMSQASWGVFV
jgi:hypothetical protein